MQAIRRDIVTSLLSGHHIQSEWVDLLRTTYDILNANTADFQREMISSKGDKFQVNVKDEIIGLQKDLKFLDHVKDAKQSDSTMPGLLQVDFCEILAPYHPISKEKFLEEYANCTRFMRSFVNSASEEGRKPIFVTDWDGTMKDYCSQYATNLQPIYSAISMAQFASRFTRLTAVLTAGPLRGPGILDLTALPIDGPVMFSGSWGREWWLGGKRVVHDDGISNEGIDALERFNDEMRSLLSSAEYSQFGLVGSGVQRKVDRLTLGVQTVCKHVHPDLSNRYQDEVRERVHRVDPQKQILHFDPSTELEVEIVVQSDGSVWNKANGVERLIETVGDTLHPPGRVLICGDTSSDLPMVQHAVQFNPQGVMSLFVGAKPELRSKVLEIVGDEERVCFISCPDVVHAAMTQILKEFKERRDPTDIKRNSENGTTAVENHN
jgi:hypothetical protein